MQIKKYEVKIVGIVPIMGGTKMSEPHFEVGYFQQESEEVWSQGTTTFKMDKRQSWRCDFATLDRKLAEQVAARKNDRESVLHENLKAAMKNSVASLGELADGVRRMNEACRASEEIFEDVKKQWDRPTYAQLEVLMKQWRAKAIGIALAAGCVIAFLSFIIRKMTTP